MDFRYPKEEKLKSHTTISSLFTEGKSVSKYPLRLVYVALPEGEKSLAGVSVSKRYFKRAVDRNYFKRILRENYRLQKEILQQLERPYAFMIFYQTSDRLPFEEVKAKMTALFEKFVTATTGN